MKQLGPVALLSVILAPLGFAEPPDVKTLILKSIQNYDRDWRAGMQYGYTQMDVIRKGDLKTEELSEVMPLHGTPYERVVAKNGRPLTAEEKTREDEKYQKTLAKRQSESEEERKARIRKYEGHRAFLKDLPHAFDFKLLGEEVVDGRPSWIVGLTPRADFVPMTPRGAMLKGIEGKLWIDKQELHWAKAEADVVSTISYGWIVARVGPGSKIRLDMTRLSEGVWVPSKIDIDGSAKVMMLATKSLKEEIIFTDYRRVEAPRPANSGSPANTMAKSFR